MLGWPGCYGFNRLLHQNTAYPLQSVIKDPRDISYSGNTYIKDRHWYDRTAQLSSYCPECVREDIRYLGFSFWRRTFPNDVSVCTKHNQVLLTVCPFCDKPFSIGGHALDVMWKRCSGNHLGEARGVINKDREALKRARFVDGLCSLAFHIPDDAAIFVITEKLHSLRLSTSALKSKRRLMLDRLKRALLEVDRAAADNDSQNLNSFTRAIFETLLFAYESFDDFIADFLSYGDSLRSIDSLWATYQASGYESASYVTESYGDGVGVWSCPFPSHLSNSCESKDGLVKEHPIKYHCCDYNKLLKPSSRGRQSMPRLVAPALPAIPAMNLQLGSSPRAF